MADCCGVTHQSPAITERGVSQFVGAVVFIDALGRARCGITGIYTSACACFDDMRHGLLPPPDYKGTGEYDADTDTMTREHGQAPLAITAG